VFESCKFKEGNCAFSGTYKGKKYCGVARGTNKVDLMLKCPLPDIKKTSKITAKRQGL
jgi:hypothetical protein